MKIYKGDLVIECTTEEYLELKDVLYKPKPKTGESKGAEKSIIWRILALEMIGI